MGNADAAHLGIDRRQLLRLPGSPATTTANTTQRRLTYLVNPSQGQYYGDIQQTDDGAVAEYHGLLLSARAPPGQPLHILSTFNWSHCISDWDFGGELAGTVYQNPLNRSAEHGACSFDHRLNSNTSLVAISGGIGNALSKAVTKDWQLSPLISLLSGAPLQISTVALIIPGAASGGPAQRSELNAVIPSTQTLTQWFTQAAFAVATHWNVREPRAGCRLRSWNDSVRHVFESRFQPLQGGPGQHAVPRRLLQHYESRELEQSHHQYHQRDLRPDHQFQHTAPNPVGAEAVLLKE